MMDCPQAKYPTISVIVITKNNSSTIEKCIIGLLNQNYPKDCYEIIFVDGMSSDGTREIIEKYAKLYNLPPITLYSENVGTMGYARNVGISKSNGEILAFIDGDAYPTNNWLLEIVQRFMINKDLAILGGLDVFTSGNIAREIISHWRRLKKGVGLKAITKIRTVNFAIKRDVILSCGGFDSELNHFDETELMARLYFTLNVKKVLFDPELKVFHEKKHDSLTHRIKKVFKKSVAGLPVLFKSYMIKMAILHPLSAIGTSLFFVFANFAFFIWLFFMLIGLIPWTSFVILLVGGLLLVFLYTIAIKLITGKFNPEVFFILTLDSLVRFFGTFTGLIMLLLTKFSKKRS